MKCLRILIDCSQLSKTYYSVLFSSSTRDRHARRHTYRERSENNIKCIGALQLSLSLSVL